MRLSCVAIPMCLSLSLASVITSEVSAQDRSSDIAVELGGGWFLPTNDLNASAFGTTRLKSSPTMSLAILKQTRTAVAFRARGVVGLQAGTVTSILTGPAAGTKSTGPHGRVFLGLAEVLIGLNSRPQIELAGGLGVRTYQFGNDDCSGTSCGGSATQSGIVGSVGAAVATKLGGTQVGFEISALLSGYQNRTMHDVLLGVRLRF